MNVLQLTGLSEPELIFVTMLAAMVLLSAVIGRWGETKGKSFWGGFLLSLFISPAVGALVVALTGTTPVASPVRVSRF